MVYNDRSNFVGDTHWRKDLEFEDGEQLELERGGILVEVGECIGKRDQDLTELVDKRVKRTRGEVRNEECCIANATSIFSEREREQATNASRVSIAGAKVSECSAWEPNRALWEGRHTDSVPLRAETTGDAG